MNTKDNDLPPYTHNRGEAIVKALLAAVACAYIATYLFLVVRRIAYPFELEWIEGGVVGHVVRILSGRQIYAEPSIEFTALPYTPLYYYISALFAWVMGPGFLPLRLVSVLASLGCLAIIYRIVKRETCSTTCGIVAAGIFAASYNVMIAFFDIARVDTLAMFFVLWTVAVLKNARTPLGLIGAALLAAMAVFTKQSAVLVLGPLCLYSLVCLPGRLRYVFAATFAVLCIGTALLLNWLSDGWFLYYTFRLQQAHPLAEEMVRFFWLHDVLGTIPFALAVSAWFFVSLLQGRKRSDAIFYVCWGIGAFGASLLLRMNQGGAGNVLMPMMSLVAVMAGLGLGMSMQPAAVAEGRAAPFSRAVRRWSGSLTVIACMLQFFMLWYQPASLIPTAEDQAAGRELLSIIRQTGGEVYVASHGSLGSLAGKGFYAHTSPMNDVMRSTDRKEADRLCEEIKRTLDSGRFAMVILDRETPWMQPGDNYTVRRLDYPDERVFCCVAGAPMRPTFIYERKN